MANRQAALFRKSPANVLRGALQHGRSAAKTFKKVCIGSPFFAIIISNGVSHCK